LRLDFHKKGHHGHPFEELRQKPRLFLEPDFMDIETPMLEGKESKVVFLTTEGMANVKTFLKINICDNMFRTLTRFYRNLHNF
jgi:hypothetical protein